MRVKAAVIFCVIFLLFGCSSLNSGLEQAQILRNRLSAGSGCSFRANITADYGASIYEFSLQCEADNLKNLSFTVLSPESISGITGRISAQGANLTFDDKILAFETIADGQITPVAAPWVFITALQGGYLNGCARDANGYMLTVDDSYRDDALRLNIRIDKNLLPQWAEIFWQNRRVLTITVEDFTIL